MTSKNHHLYASLLSGSMASVAGRLFLATRPMFFAASILPVLVGTAWGVRTSGELDIAALALALAATVCVHAAVNVINDVYDDLIGTDPINTERIYPFTGGSRFIQNGVVERVAMARWGRLLLVFAAVLGTALSLIRGIEVLGFGLIGGCLGVLYSVPPVQLSARGLGELAVGIGFGVLPVAGAAWLQCGILSADTLLISLPLSCWVLNVVLINEIPDARADAAVGKDTLVVRWGILGTRRMYLAANVLALLAVGAAVFQGLLPVLILILPSCLLLTAINAARGLRPDAPKRQDLASTIKTTLAIHAAGGIWLTVFAWPW